MANVLEEFQQQKKQVIKLAQQSVAYGWITQERYSEIVKKIESDILTIGVIGQMKCGKSTFLNSFVFESDVLPAATTPMTASLSVITYGEKEKIVAEFYTKDEWQEQKMQASRDLASLEGNELEQAKVQAAQELVAKAKKLGTSLESYLGKTQEDTLASLEEYVGAEGKYISITKAVKIYYPKEYLKGVEIVDTPGMNDPIVSREERTKEFLTKADVVLMMLYAGRPFDAKDRTILFEDVKKCGIGKVVIGVNKYDIPYGEREYEEEIKQYVIEEIQKTCKECNDESLTELVKERDPILLSAQMALLSQLPMTKISENESYNFDWHKYCKMFEISSQKDFREKSRMDVLGQVVIDLITKEKGKILLAKPKNEIIAAGNTKNVELEKALMDVNNEIKMLEISPEDLEETKSKLEKANKGIRMKIRLLTSFFDKEFTGFVPDCKKKIKELFAENVKKMERIVDDEKFSTKYVDSCIKLDREHQNFFYRELPKVFSDEVRKFKNKLKDEVIKFFEDIGEICIDKLNDFDVKDFLAAVQSAIIMKIDYYDDFKISHSFKKSKGLFENKKTILRKTILEYDRNYGDFSELFEPLQKEKDTILDEIKKHCLDELITPLQEQLNECMSNLSNRQQQLEKAKERLGKLEKEKVVLQQQIQEIKSLS